MKILVIGLLTIGSISAHCAIESYLCKTIHTNHQAPEIKLDIKTAFHTFSPKTINGKAVYGTDQYLNFYKRPEINKFKVHEEDLYFMQGTTLNSFYQEKSGDKVYMFNHAFSHNRWNPEESPAYLAIKEQDIYSYYKCDFVSTTSWF